MSRTAVVAGVGPGLGESIARRFARENCDVALLARSRDDIDRIAADLESAETDALAVPTDVTNEDDVREAFDAIASRLGGVDILVHNAGKYLAGGIDDIEAADVENTWRVAAYGGFLCAQAVVPGMRENGRGTVIFTGATSAIRGPAGGLAFGSAKFAVRGMAESLARELGPEGIHVAHAVIDGQIDTPAAREREPDRDPETFLDPDAIADAYWHLVEQDRSAWTLELDLRPHVEEF